MRLVHYLSEVRLSHGGVVRAVLDLSDALARAGHDVTLLTFDDTDVPFEWQRPGARGCPRAVTMRWPRFPKPMRRFASADLKIARHAIEGADALHLHVPWESTNLQLASIARRAGVPYAISTHGMLDEWTIAQGLARKRLYLKLAGRGLLDGAASVLCTAVAERDQARQWFTNLRADVLPLLMDLRPFEREPDQTHARSLLFSAPGTGPIVLFLSRLHPKKGLEVLIDAAALLSNRGVVFRLVIAGKEDHAAPGYEAALRAHIARANLADRATMVGLVTGQTRDALLASAAVSVLPTSQENWGFSLIESLAAGTPVVTTRGVDIWRELEQSGGAAIADQNPEAFARAIEPLLTSPDAAASMGKAGRFWVMTQLDPAKVLTQYEAYYASLRGAR